MTNAEMVFVGFNGKAAALDRQTGEILWQWTAPKGAGYVSLLLDGDSLLAAVNGYTYCLDPRTGQQLWFNPMKGFGF
ncbi:MAG: PQQ-binding-like beta-propeller repeat protein, partial [Planctomycetes bacterium]|nr:PQQ-binding-like beta-propeller repeat protein [Planctomycetota bacterium]